MTKHFPILVSSSAGRDTVYKCPCGYESTNSKEFVPVTNPSTKGVTCVKALEYLVGSRVIVKDTEVR